MEPFDETGMRVNGQWWWLHVACTDGLTVRLTLTAEAYYFVHPKRGQAAMDEMNILPQFEGKAVHDSWVSYDNYEGCTHDLRHAHHLRESTFILDASSNPGPSR